MNHQTLTLNHRLESWVFANAAARNAAGAYVAADVGRIGFQSDNKQYYRLLTTAPTWADLSPVPAAAIPHAVVQSSGLMNPVHTTLLSPGAMMGCGVGYIITPTGSGTVVAMFGGYIQNLIASKASACQMRYGTGAAPVNGAAGSAGTALGPQPLIYSNLAGAAAPFSVFGLAQLTVGVPYWFDLALWTNAAGDAVVTSVAMTLFEIPA